MPSGRPLPRALGFFKNMLVVLALIAPLLLIWAFIRWDKNRIERSHNPVTREALDRGFRPSTPVAWKLWAGLSLVYFALGISDLMTPPKPPFTGRWSWVGSMLTSELGPYGIAYLEFFISVLMLATSIAFYKQRSTK